MGRDVYEEPSAGEMQPPRRGLEVVLFSSPAQQKKKIALGIKTSRLTLLSALGAVCSSRPAIPHEATDSKDSFGRAGQCDPRNVTETHESRAWVGAHAVGAGRGHRARLPAAGVLSASLTQLRWTNNPWDGRLLVSHFPSLVYLSACSLPVALPPLASKQTSKQSYAEMAHELAVCGCAQRGVVEYGAGVPICLVLSSVI
jgi:hypothetical protein